MYTYTLTLLALLTISFSYGQLEIGMDGSSALINFEDTVLGVNSGHYVAEDPPTPEPVEGQIDADAWKFLGLNSTGDTSQGIDLDGGVSPGGIYAFVVGLDTFMGVQPTNSDFTPGSITLVVVNRSGGSINVFDLAFEQWINNDQDRANSFNVSVSVDDMTYVEVPALSDTSTEASDALGFQSEVKTATVVLPAAVADGDTLFIRWESDDITGSGARDEFGIDDIQITNAVLPVELLSFFAEPVGQAVELQWETSSEHSNDYFSIERSADGILFNEIGTVRGQGWSSEQYQYTFKDAHPLPGISYYRLVQYDYDGQSQAYQLRTVKRDDAFRVFPTLALHYLQVQVPASHTQLTILNQEGQRIAQYAIDQKMHLDVSRYLPGLYYLVIKAGNNNRTLTFVKL